MEPPPPLFSRQKTDHLPARVLPLRGILPPVSPPFLRYRKPVPPWCDPGLSPSPFCLSKKWWFSQPGCLVPLLSPTGSPFCIFSPSFFIFPGSLVPSPPVWCISFLIEFKLSAWYLLALLSTSKATPPFSFEIPFHFFVLAPASPPPHFPRRKTHSEGGPPL